MYSGLETGWRCLTSKDFSPAPAALLNFPYLFRLDDWSDFQTWQVFTFPPPCLPKYKIRLQQTKAQTQNWQPQDPGNDRHPPHHLNDAPTHATEMQLWKFQAHFQLLFGSLTPAGKVMGTLLLTLHVYYLFRWVFFQSIPPEIRLCLLLKNHSHPDTVVPLPLLVFVSYEHLMEV